MIHFVFLGANITIARAWKWHSVSFVAAKRIISWIITQEKVVRNLKWSGIPGPIIYIQ